MVFSAFLRGYGGGVGVVLPPLVFLCVVCGKNDVVLRNYLSLGGAVGPDQ
jgi:hypothetical protein